MYVCTMRLRAHSCTKKSEKKLSSYETLYFVVHLGQHCLLTQIAELKFAILVAIQFMPPASLNMHQIEQRPFSPVHLWSRKIQKWHHKENMWKPQENRRYNK